MKSIWMASLLAAAAALFLTASQAGEPVRQMNVWQGPETVFKQPVGEIVPELKGAKPTHRNGRVGNEFVFWGFKLADGSVADLYACAVGPGVDCLARRDAICDGTAKVISENTSMGEVERLNCRATCVADASTARPCCTGNQQSADLNVGLVSCE